MVSHTECSAGGSHSFIHDCGDDDGGVDMVIESACSKCNEVWEREIFVADNDYEYIDCDPKACSGSTDGHSWYNRKQETSGSDIYYLSRCHNCDGESKDWWRHKRNEYADANDNIIHKESV